MCGWMSPTLPFYKAALAAVREDARALLSLGMDLLPHTHPAWEDAGVMVTASPQV